jgi:hypothetical protein
VLGGGGVAPYILKKVIVQGSCNNVHSSIFFLTRKDKGRLIHIDGVLEWMIAFIAPYTFTQFGTTTDTALSLFYTLSSSPLHTLGFPVFTSRIQATDIHSLTVTSNHT